MAECTFLGEIILYPLSATAESTNADCAVGMYFLITKPESCFKRP